MRNNLIESDGHRIRIGILEVHLPHALPIPLELNLFPELLAQFHAAADRRDGQIRQGTVVSNKIEARPVSRIHHGRTITTSFTR